MIGRIPSTYQIEHIEMPRVIPSTDEATFAVVGISRREAMRIAIHCIDDPATADIALHLSMAVFPDSDVNTQPCEFCLRQTSNIDGLTPSEEAQDLKDLFHVECDACADINRMAAS